MPSRRLERYRPAPLAGVDEAGRGPWAGPVVAAAVVFLPYVSLPPDLDDLDDSKQLTAEQRDELHDKLIAARNAGLAWFAVAQATVGEIATHNVLGATKLAMARAVMSLPALPAWALVDGNQPPHLPCPVEAVVKGDARSTSIAAASVLAKVTRDRIMQGLAGRHPGYGWETNAGYGTAQHRDALDRLGITAHHRTDFAPIRARLAATG